VVLPGVRIDERAVLGSGTVAPESFHFLPKSVYVGSDPLKGKPYCLEVGDLSFKPDSEKSPEKFSPFGEAFYRR
jgi:hypothetical protein